MNRFVLSIFLIFSSLIFGVFVVLPRFQEFSAVQKEFKAKKAELESRESYFSHLKTLQDRLNQEELVAKIDAAIPNDPQLPELHGFLQKLSAASGLVMRSIVAMHGTSAINSKLKRIDTALQLGGSYESFKLFLSDLHIASRMTDITSINFSSPKAGTGFVFNIRANSYSY